MEENGIVWGLEQEPSSLARFPPGEVVLPPTPFQECVFSEIDRLLAAGHCSEGRFEVEAAETRLTCLIHQSAPYLAGLLERDVYSQVPLYEFAGRVRQLAGATCSLQRSHNSVVLMAGVHFCRRPYLQGSTRLVNPAHVLRVLARQKEDAALAFERSDTRTLLFLNKGQPARLFFGDPREDPGEGGLNDRILLYAFADSAPPAKVEVFTSLKLPPDPDHGTPLATLAEATRPCPPVMVHIEMVDGREVRRRVFLPPSMIIGRDQTCTLFIDNLAVSRRHARLSWERGCFVVDDLGRAPTAPGSTATRCPAPSSRAATGSRSVSSASAWSNWRKCRAVPRPCTCDPRICPVRHRPRRSTWWGESSRSRSTAVPGSPCGPRDSGWGRSTPASAAATREPCASSASENGQCASMAARSRAPSSSPVTASPSGARSSASRPNPSPEEAAKPQSNPLRSCRRAR